MAQIKIYGLAENLNPIKAQLSDVIHSCVVEALNFPTGKRAHRFFPMERSDFYFLNSTTEKYTIVEISMFEGRTVETKKHLIRLLFERTHEVLGLAPNELEITITETPRHNWGIRGMPADEIRLDYRVDV